MNVPLVGGLVNVGFAVDGGGGSVAVFEGIGIEIREVLEIVGFGGLMKVGIATVELGYFVCLGLFGGGPGGGGRG